MKHSASKKLKSARKNKRIRIDDAATGFDHKIDDVDSPEIDFQILEDELRDISYKLDKEKMKNDLLAFIVKYGVNLNMPLPSNHQTLLDWALFSQYQLLFLDVVLETYKNNNVNLHNYIYQGLDVVPSLMDVNLHLQAQLLVYYGASPYYFDKQGVGHTLSGSSYEELTAFVEELRNAIHPGNVKQVIDQFFQENNPRTPLDGENNCLLGIAIYNKVIKPDLKYILQFYQNEIDIHNLHGVTPLMIAVLMNDLSAAKLLIKLGAKVDAKDNLGTSVLDYCMYSNRDDIFKIIYDLAPKADKTRQMTKRYKEMNTMASSKTLIMSKTFSRTNSKPTEKQIEEFVTQNLIYGITFQPTIPGLDNSLSEPHAQHWIKSHPQQLQSLTKKIIENIKHVNFSIFKSQLIACASSLKLPREYVLVLPEEVDKSNPWVFSHALPYLSHLPMKVLTPSEIAGFVNALEDKQYNFLFVDDAAFSGAQTKFSVDTVDSQFTGAHKPHIHYLIPFMTKRAHELLKRHNEAQFGDFQTIEGIEKVFTDSEKQILQDNNVNSTDPNVKHHLNWSELTLTYFEHKIADWKSTFTGIMRQGRTINDMNAKLPFIPLTIEPYKSNPSLPLEIIQGLISNQYERGLPKLPPAQTQILSSGFSSLSKFKFWQ